MGSDRAKPPLSVYAREHQISTAYRGELQTLTGDRASVSVDPGDLYMAPAPNRFHQEISRNLQFELHSFLKRNPIGKLFNAPFDVYLDEFNVFQPDIIIVLNERLEI